MFGKFCGDFSGFFVGGFCDSGNGVNPFIWGSGCCRGVWDLYSLVAADFI